MGEGEEGVTGQVTRVSALGMAALGAEGIHILGRGVYSFSLFVFFHTLNFDLRVREFVGHDSVSLEQG